MGDSQSKDTTVHCVARPYFLRQTAPPRGSTRPSFILRCTEVSMQPEMLSSLNLIVLKQGCVMRSRATATSIGAISAKARESLMFHAANATYSLLLQA